MGLKEQVAIYWLVYVVIFTAPTVVAILRGLWRVIRRGR